MSGSTADVWRFEAIGTHWEIESAVVLPPPSRAAVTALIERFDREWSRFRADSLVTGLAREAGSIAAPSDAATILDAYAALSEATGGAVNPLIGESLSALGYDSDYSLEGGAARPAPAGWQSLLHWSDAEMSLSRPAAIDVGAVGKGRLVDLVLAALADVPGALIVDAGGDLVVRGGPARVGLEHPYDASKAIGVVEVRDGALCASAVNRRAWGDGLHHVLDGRTGAPVRTWAATWAMASDAMRADAVATALFFDGGADLASRWGVEWVRMSTDGRVQRSAGCRAELFTTHRANRVPPGENAEELSV